jgi:hypothetical protein
LLITLETFSPHRYPYSVYANFSVFVLVMIYL